MKRALLHSGGNARGAVGLAVLEGLLGRHGVEGYAAAAGVSVGAINVPEAMAGRLPELRDLYEEVDGLGWYLRKRWPWQWSSGLTSIDRLRGRMHRHGTRIADLPSVPVYVGVFDFESDVYRSIDARSVRDDAAWLDARCASAAIPVVMSGWDVEVEPGVVHRCWDGGMRHVIPDLPDWQSFDAVDVILCSPMERANVVPLEQVDDFRGIVGRLVDIWIDGTVQRDLERLQRWARAGVEVTVYAPQDSGGSFDASASAMQQRFDEGARMWRAPVRL